MAHQQTHGADHGQPEGQAMRQLHHGQHRDRRILRGDGPARHRAQCRDHHQQRGRQLEPRRQREHHDLGKHAERPQPGNGQPAEAGLLPGDRGEDVIGGVAALDQRRRCDDGEKAGIAQQRRAAVRRRRGRLWAVQRLQPEAGQRAEQRHRRDHPDQMLGRDHVDQQPAGQRAHHERRRAPQPERPVIQAVARHAAQRIGVRQRRHRRPQAGGDGNDQEDRERLGLGSDQRKAERGGKRRNHHAAAQRLSALGKPGEERQHREPRHRGDGRNDTDPGCVDRRSPSAIPGRTADGFRPGRTACRKTAPAAPRIAWRHLEMRWGFVIRSASIQLRFARYRDDR